MNMKQVATPNKVDCARDLGVSWCNWVDLFWSVQFSSWTVDDP